MIKKFEAIGSLASPQRNGRPSTAAAVTTVEQMVQYLSAVATHGDCAVLEVTQTGFKTVSVTGQRYVAMLQNNIIPELQVQQALQTVPFMQDGAPPHIALPVQCLPHSIFGEDRIISRNFIMHVLQDLPI
ncbi:hypothetical protein TNCV_1621101 [Trichonephila clavipes]|nr:hypothetical protein TNCV_1621101 [Trichonephila clavipes]